MDENKKTRILLVHNYYQIPGGEDSVVANEKILLEKYGHVVIQYSRNNNELNEFSKLKKTLLPFVTIFNPKTYKDIKQIIMEKNIDIVHVHNTLALISPSVYYASIKCNVPIIQTIHNFRLLCPGATFYRDAHICEECVEYGLFCAVKNSCYHESKAQTMLCVINNWIHRLTGIYGKLNYICLTEFNKKKLLNLNQINENRVFVKPNFVDSIADIIPYDDRPNQFIFAGRLDKLKGIDTLIKAWKILGGSAPKLIICGTGPMEGWCKKFIQENQLEVVDLMGFVENKAVKRLIANSKALILPTQWYEGFPMTIVEAYSVGTPVIGSNFGNVGNIIQQNVTGWKFNSKNPEELATLIKNITAINSNVIKLMYEKKYSSKENYSLLNTIYSTVLQRR